MLQKIIEDANNMGCPGQVVVQEFNDNDIAELTAKAGCIRKCTVKDDIDLNPISNWKNNEKN